MHFDVFLVCMRVYVQIDCLNLFVVLAMEQLAGALGGELSISLDINDTSAPHPR